jgi:hypothetical protein
MYFKNIDNPLRGGLMASLLVTVLLQQLCQGAQARPPQGRQDIGWPRQVTKDGAQLMYYQPQAGEWKDFRNLTCEMAFSLTPKSGHAVLGVASIHAITDADNETRTVTVENVTATSVRFTRVKRTEENSGFGSQGDLQYPAKFSCLKRDVGHTDQSNQDKGRCGCNDRVWDGLLLSTLRILGTGLSDL